MVLQSLSGLPAFLVYFVCACVLVAAYVFVYTWITAHDEFALLKANNTGAAIALGLSMIGFALPLTASIGHSDGILDMTIWGVIALIVQVGVYYVARIAVPKLS
ncbi:MAG: putative rane protein, partial [Hyphomicrobiales bacterium]|nr:putative rane protein [Hyphomicrobiales bacterium]